MKKECLTCRNYFDEGEIINDELSKWIAPWSEGTPRCRSCVKKVKKIRIVFFIFLFAVIISFNDPLQKILLGVMIAIYLVLFFKGLI